MKSPGRIFAITVLDSKEYCRADGYLVWQFLGREDVKILQRGVVVVIIGKITMREFEGVGKG